MSGEAIEQKVVQIIDQLQGLAQPAMQIAISSTRVNAILCLCVGVLCAGIAAVTAKYMLQNIKKANDSNYDEGLPFAIIAIFLGIFTVGFIVATALNLLNPDNWLAAIRPDLYLAQILLHRAL